MMWGNGFNIQGWGGLLGLPVAVGIVFLVIWAVRAFGSRASREGSAGAAGILPTQARQSVARQALDDSYSKGELTNQQYQERLNVLGETRP